MPKKGSRPKKSQDNHVKSVTVRMYNGGFGDTFLLTFNVNGGGKPRYMLIDCGVHDKDPEGKAKMLPIAQNISDVTNKKLNVVAVTHEHSDHLWGFKHAQDIFEKVEIDELWLPWTEDQTNTVTQELRRLYGKKIKALQAVTERLKASDLQLAQRLESILAFEAPLIGAAGLRGNADILEFLRKKSSKAPEKPEEYKTPGDLPIELQDLKGVKIYVLGPPMDIASIKKMDSAKETYLGFSGLKTTSDFATAVFAADKDAQNGPSWGLSPFSKTFCITIEEAAADSIYGKFFKDFYGVENGSKNSPDWRRIDNDWLSLADELALSIGDYTNNTSLVLAIELTETNPRKVLLFAADAQAGNWLSWQKLEWQEPDGSGNPDKTRKVTGSDLLTRTVFYKVGHHGSRNATLKTGLELMHSNELVAFISVDEAFSKDRGWGHPEAPVVNKLLEKTRGRVIRSDEIPSGNQFDQPNNISDKEWKTFVSNLNWDKSPRKLWIEYTIS